MPTPLDLAYLGGFFDGEGCVTWQKTLRKTGKTYKLLRIDIGQVDRTFLEWCHKTFGGNIYTRPKNKHRSKQENYQWTVTGKVAAQFLNTLIPYLRQKQEHAKQCLTEWENRHE